MLKWLLTRTTDIYHSPVTKANIANNNKGDLFISIHCNAAPGIRHSKITAIEPKFIIPAKAKKEESDTVKFPVIEHGQPQPRKRNRNIYMGSAQNSMKEKAMRENEALYLDSATANFVKDFDPNSPEKMILYSLKTQQYFNRSANLAITGRRGI